MSIVETNEVFIWNGITIRQEKDVFKVGTDALLLGAWIPRIIKSPSLILDAGTGTGIIALMMGFFFPEARIVAVDQEEAAVRLAHHNFQLSMQPERLFVQHENILEVPSSEKDKYDLILCNPPFYFDQYQAKTGVQIKAKHALAPALTWLEALFGILNSTGHLCIVLPYEMAFDWIRSANGIGLYCQHRLDIFSFRDDLQPKRSLIHLHSNLMKPDISRLDIHEQFNTYTEAYLTFSGIQQQNNKMIKPHQRRLKSSIDSKRYGIKKGDTKNSGHLS